MTTPTVFPDAQLGVIDLLRDDFTARYTDDETPAPTVGARLPIFGALESPTLPYVMVRQDAASTRYPADETVTIRVTVWNTSEAKALALAQLCRGVILSTVGTSIVRATKSLTGPVPASDPDTGERMATFTVSVHTRPATPV